ncbi:MAG: UDP-glucose/GDP-mannose dehydrogenase family protein [Candidatus Omnitrophica bacterium]|nr:UDP-glucose/GDP-mannose dehydrogenase family protein [Candidatus Omnitrophota bacterium]
MKISIVGAGHVGLVTGACFAESGHQVLCVDNDMEKLAPLQKGKIPFYEPGLERLVRKHLKTGRLSFSPSIQEGVRKSGVVFIAVGTPSRPSGEADLSYVEVVSREIAHAMTTYRLIVEKSTVPVETGEWVRRTIRHSLRRKIPFDVASNPEFLREGQAVKDFLQPDRVVIGVESKKAEKILLEVYRPLKTPIVVTDIKSAEIIKHASNSFLSMKISFINAIATLSEKVGADVVKIAEGVGMDKRIGKSFLNAGVGFGGSCFGKDLAAFINIASKAGVDFQLLKEVQRINQHQREGVVRKIEQAVWNLRGKTIGILGLSFKPDTDDLRDAPAIDIIRALQKEGVKVKATDPAAMENAKKFLTGVTFCANAYEVARGVDCLVILTEWRVFKQLHLRKLKSLMAHPVLVDGRNLFDPERMRRLGFRYFSMGRPAISS